MADKEHTAASLGHSEVLSVKDPVGPPIPEFPQRPDNGSKRPSAVVRQDAGDVLPYHPLGAYAVSSLKELKGEVATRVIQSAPEAGDGEGLAGASSDENIDTVSPLMPIHLRDVAQVREVRVVVRQHRRRKRLRLGGEHRLPSETAPGDLRGTDAGE
jgi:hypothetical protein